MTKRTTKKTVVFGQPFSLSGLPAELPAGTYEIETDEEMIEGLSFVAFHRVLTLLHLPANPKRPGLRESLTVDGRDLDTAIAKDRAACAADDRGR